MVTVNKIGGSNTTKEVQLFGLSADDKPTENISNGSLFYCIDSQELLMFDEENSEWILQ